MIIYVMFGLVFLVIFDALRQCVSVSLNNGRLTISEKSGDVVFAGLIKMDCMDGISFEIVKRGESHE